MGTASAVHFGRRVVVMERSANRVAFAFARDGSSAAVPPDARAPYCPNGSGQQATITLNGRS
jgi:hypothetical protein